MRSLRPKFQNHLIFITFYNRIFVVLNSRSFELGDLGVLKKSLVNIFNDYIFEISLFHWSKCTIECDIRLTLISKSAQVRCGLLLVFFVLKALVKNFKSWWNKRAFNFLKKMWQLKFTLYTFWTQISKSSHCVWASP